MLTIIEMFYSDFKEKVQQQSSGPVMLLKIIENPEKFLFLWAVSVTIYCVRN